MASLATRAGVEGRPLRILAPLLRLSKADIIRRGAALGLDYGLTHSCYDPRPGGGPCGRATAAGCGREASPKQASQILFFEARTVTERLYYTDPCLTEFDAPSRCQIVTAPEGGLPLVLDRTAFYPDVRRPALRYGDSCLAAFSDVIDLDDGTILHVLSDAPAWLPG